MPATADVAVVIGSGVAGLATAQVLSEFFDRVIVLERDCPEANNDLSAVAVANKDDARPGVAQYTQLHALLARGLKEFDDIFQGRFTQALLAAGANLVPQYRSYLVCHPISGANPWLRNTNPKQQALSAICTRHLLETATRKLLMDNPRVEFVYRGVVTGLVFDGEAGDSKVTAAAAADHDGNNKQRKGVSGVRLSDGSTLSAQLVVDCSGRGSNLPGWLAAGGYKRPRTSRAGCNTGYSTWFCKLDPEIDAVLKQNDVYVHVAMPAAPVRTCSLFMRCEGDVWLAGVGGNEGAYPGHDPGDLLPFAEEEVWHPSAARILKGSTQLSPATHKHGLNSTWRHYEEVALPDGLLVLGDAICSFNPLYGQGMTVAAIEATALKRLLTERKARSSSSSSSSGSAECLHGLHQQLQKAILPTIKLAWQLAVGGDMRYPSATSNDSAGGNAAQRLLMSYVDLLFKYSATDATVNEGLLRVTNMLDEPSALFHPQLMSRVFTYQLLGYLPTPLVTTLHSMWHKGGALLPWFMGNAWGGAAVKGSPGAMQSAGKADKGAMWGSEALLKLLGCI